MTKNYLFLPSFICFYLFSNSDTIFNFFEVLFFQIFSELKHFFKLTQNYLKRHKITSERGCDYLQILTKITITCEKNNP